MGTSLSGLTPATTFDGLLKTSDNEPLDGTLKAISTGEGTDTILQLSDSELKVAGQFNVDDGNGNTLGNAITIGNDKLRLGHNFNNAMLSSPSGKVLLVSASGIGIGNSYAAADSATARLQVKGSGATSATTSLLVQNSAGGSVFSVRDDGTLLFYRSSNSAELLRIDDTGTSPRLVAGSNTGKSLTLGNDAITSAYSNIQFKTYDGSAYSEAMRITGANDQLVGIGETTPTARLHVKGSGNDNTTTSLLVQNSDGADMLKVTDDRNIETYDATGNVISQNDAATSTFVINPSLTSNVDFRVAGGGGKVNLLKVDSGLNSVSIGTGGVANTRFVIKGDGATSATTALLVQNSDGDDVFKTTDDGGTILKSFGASNTLILDSNAGVSAFEMQSNNGSQRFRIQATSTTTRFTPNNTDGFNFLGNAIFTSGAFDTAAARLQVKGSGNDNTTTALLVQNSDGANAFRITDNKIGHFFSHLNIDGQNYVAGNLSAGSSSVPSGTRAYIKGSGATSATTALLVENSAGTDLLKVTDNNVVSLASQNYSFSPSQATFGKKLAIGVTANQSSAVLEIASTTQGFLPPRMTTTERDAITSPASGLMVYNTTTNKAQCYNGTTWNDLF